MPFVLNSSALNLVAATQAPQNSISLRKYPSDLFTAGAEAFMIINIIDAVARGGKSYGKIALYLPPTLRVKYEAQYEEVEMDLKKLTGFLGGFASLSGFGDNLMRGVANAATSVGLNVDRSLEQTTGQVVNPHMASLFRNIGFRSFQFDFHMMAKSQDESDSIRDIIALLKFHMHPELRPNDPNRFMQYPENFIVEFYTPTEEYMFKIGLSALTGMEVDYAGSGVPSFFTNSGAPVDIRMSLTFKELAILTKTDIRAGF